MRSYELTIIFKPTLEAKELDKQVANIKAIVEKAGGKITSKTDAVKKALAYEIEHNKEGYYAFFAIDMDPSAVAEVDTSIKLEDAMLRYLLIHKD